MTLKVISANGTVVRIQNVKYSDNVEQAAEELYSVYPRHFEGTQTTKHKVYLHIRSGSFLPNIGQAKTVKDFINHA